MRIRGSALIHARRFISAEWGAQALASLDQRLPPAVLETFASSAVLGHGWYPVHVWNTVVEHVAAEHGAASIGALAAFVAHKDLTAPYRVLLAIGRPQIVFRRAGVFWSKYFDGGKLEGIPLGPNHFRTELRAGCDPQQDPGRLTCAEAVPAWQEQAIRLTGFGGGKSRHVRCRFDGHPCCEYDVRWDG